SNHAPAAPRTPGHDARASARTVRASRKRRRLAGGEQTKMAQSVKDIVNATPVIDVHEHHFPEILLNPDVDLLQLFRQSYAGWSPPTSLRDPIPAGPTTWETLAPFLTESGSNSFVRNLVRAVTEIHGKGEGEITPANWRALDASI